MTTPNNKKLTLLAFLASFVMSGDSAALRLTSKVKVSTIRGRQCCRNKVID